MLAITFTILVIALIANYLLGSDDLPGWLSKGVGITLMIFIVFGMFFTFIDFITLGFLKKKKWLSRIYFPMYWVFSFITLSFLYRPLVYNFLDNKFGKRLSFALVPFYILITLILTLRYKTSNYFDSNSTSTEVTANSSNYEDSLGEGGFIDDVAIQSKVITDAYLKVFILFSESIENRVYNKNAGLRPIKDERGLVTSMTFNNTGDIFIDPTKKDSLRREYIKTFNSIYYVKIDTTVYSPEFIISENNKKLGFESYVPTKSLSEGKHILRVRRKAIQDQDTTYWNVATIPFWYFKD